MLLWLNRNIDNEDVSGLLFEISGGWAAQTRWQRSGGYVFPSKKPYSPEDVVAKWQAITTFGMLKVTRVGDVADILCADNRATHPTSTSEAVQQIIENFDNVGEVKAKL